MSQSKTKKTLSNTLPGMQLSGTLGQTPTDGKVMRHGLVWRYAKHGRWFARWRVAGRPRLKFVAIPSGQDIWTLRVDLNNKEVSRERCPSSEDVFKRAAQAVRLVQRGIPFGVRPIDTVRAKAVSAVH